MIDIEDDVIPPPRSQLPGSAGVLAQWRRICSAPHILNAYLRLRDANDIGWGTRVWGNPRIINQGSMSFGKQVQVVSRVARSEFVTSRHGRLTIGDHVYINYGAAIAAHRLITIGSHTLIGTHCIIMDNDYHHVDVTERRCMPESQPVIIGDHVWIGARVTILKGVTIGEYAVIGAGSVVTRDVPPLTLVAGVPACPIRQITTSDTMLHNSSIPVHRSLDRTSLPSLLCFGAAVSQLAI